MFQWCGHVEVKNSCFLTVAECTTFPGLQFHNVCSGIARSSYVAINKHVRHCQLMLSLPCSSHRAELLPVCGCVGRTLSADHSDLLYIGSRSVHSLVHCINNRKTRAAIIGINIRRTSPRRFNTAFLWLLLSRFCLLGTGRHVLVPVKQPTARKRRVELR